MKFMKNLSVLLSAAVILCSLSACTDNITVSSDKLEKMAMVSDTGGIHDQSFNQSAWEGFQKFNEIHPDVEISYLESVQESEYASNLDILVDSGNNLIFGIGAVLADAMETVAMTNPDVDFILCDTTLKKLPKNVTSLTFRAEESAFVVGYIAGKTTKTNKVGFVGGMDNSVIYQFQYGYNAGVLYAAKERGVNIEVSTQYADSFSDIAKGKAIANKMYSNGCDILFHASGAVGLGVIESAKTTGNYVIGVDKDQSILAPDNILTSALKNLDKAILFISEKKYMQEDIAGKNYSLGLKEDIIGIPEHNKNMEPEIFDAAIILEEKIRAEEIIPPYNKQTFDEFKSTL